MHDSIRIKNLDEQTASTLVDDVLARFRPRLIQEQDDWEVQVDSETEDDLPDLISILRSRLPVTGSEPAITVNGETYRFHRD